MSTLIMFAVILFVASVVAQKKRRCLNARVGARPRPLFGGFAFLVVGALVLYWLAAPRSDSRVEHVARLVQERILDVQEELAIHNGTPLDRARQVHAYAQGRAIVEREKVKQMIANAATKVTDDNIKILNVTAQDGSGDEDPKQTGDTKLPAEADVSTPPAAPRPKWVDEPTGLVNGVYYKNVSSGPYATVAGCDEALPAELNIAVDQFIDSYLGSGASHLVHLPLGYVQDELVKARYEETSDFSIGPMKNVHVQLVFDGKAREVIKRRYQNALADVRMKEVAIGAGSVLLLLGAMFSYLKLDTATRGYYTGRLRVATALAILGGGAAVFSLVRHL